MNAGSETGALVSTLWIGDRLSFVERVCLASFARFGQRIVLYAYGPIDGVPKGVELRDARAILPESAVFRYGPAAGDGAGSPAGFANLFRYAMLARVGGWWVDTDVICLRALPAVDGPVAVFETDRRVNNAVLHAPLGHVLPGRLATRAAAMGRDVAWGETGPRLLTAVLEEENLVPGVWPAPTFYPFLWDDWPAPFEAARRGWVEARVEASIGVHLWQEMMRRNGFAKDGPFEDGCWFVEVARALGLDPPTIQA